MRVKLSILHIRLHIRDSFRQLVVDASLCAQKNDLSAPQLDPWLLVNTTAYTCTFVQHSITMISHRFQDMKLLAQGMAEAAFAQYATNLNKIEVHEFIAFAKVS